MKHNIPVSEEGYAVLKAHPLRDSSFVVTESCPFCSLSHIHVNPKKDERGNIPLRKSHCPDTTLTCISNKGLLVGNHIYYLDVDEHDTRSTKTED